MSFPSFSVRVFCRILYQARSQSQVIKVKTNPINAIASTKTSNSAQQIKIIEEKRLEHLMGEEEANQNILDQFLKTIDEPSVETTMEPIKSSEIAEARKRRAETGKGTYRKIVYTNGELDGSRLDEPPSPSNPHPFDPSVLPPIHSHTLLPFVNYSPILRFLVDIGVDLAEIENTCNIGKYLMRLQIEDVKEKIDLLMDTIGFEDNDVGPYLTRNPYFLIQDVNDMKTRLNYLEMKKFKKEERMKIVKEYRYWLNCKIELIDSRLGWIQQNFGLSAKLTREVIVKEPRIIMFGTGPLERLVKMMLNELNFSKQQLKMLVIKDPRLFMMDSKIISKTYQFVRDVMRINNETIIENPLILRCSLRVIKLRHDFLRKIGRANYELVEREESKTDETKIEEKTGKEMRKMVELIKIEDFLHPSDAGFAKLAAKTYPVAYDRFLRNS